MSKKKHDIFRDDGYVHVLADPCVTCIFGPNRTIRPGRAQDLLESCVRRNRITPCHEFMNSATPVVCRGLYNTGRVSILQIAERLGAIMFDDLPTPPEYTRAVEETRRRAKRGNDDGPDTPREG